jgi:hypothetical protein
MLAPYRLEMQILSERAYLPIEILFVGKEFIKSKICRAVVRAHVWCELVTMVL